MALFQPTYTDKKTGKKKTSQFWWVDFTIGDKRVRESAETTRKTIAVEYEKRRRAEFERSLAGLPVEAARRRVSTVGELVKSYLDDYPINHRKNSTIFATKRLAHVKVHLGHVLLPDLSEDRITAYIKARIAAGAGGRTINMELGELSRAVGYKWSVLWPKVRKLEENHDVGQALSPEQEAELFAAAAGDTSPNRNPAIYPYLCIALSTGMRAGEIASLRWCDLDMAAGLITVGRAKTRAGTGRQIPINPDLIGVLEEHARWYERKLGERQPEWYMFPGRAGRPKEDRQRPLDPERPIGDITTAWDALREKTGIDAGCTICDTPPQRRWPRTAHRRAQCWRFSGT